MKFRPRPGEGGIVSDEGSWVHFERRIPIRRQGGGFFVGFKEGESRFVVGLPINTRNTFSKTWLGMLSSLQRPNRPNAGVTSAKPNKDVNLAP